MSNGEQVHQFYGDRRYILRLRLRIEDSGPLSNRDLLSIAHVVDWVTRSATRHVVLEIGPHLGLEAGQARSLARRFDDLPAAALEEGELVELRRGSWQLVLDLPDTAIVLLLLYLLRITLGRDIEAVWSTTRASARFRELLARNIPEALRSAAEFLSASLRSRGYLGSRHVVDSVDVRVTDHGRETQVLVKARKSEIVRPQDMID